MPTERCGHGRSERGTGADPFQDCPETAVDLIGCKRVGLALDNGVTREELAELATHLAFYAGWPAGMSAATTLKQVLDAR